MKNCITIMTVVCCLALLFSCNGRTAKKGEETIKKLYKEYKALKETDAFRYYQTKRRINTFMEMRENISKCSICSGYGIVYMVDDYGNYYGQYDDYGNFYPIIYTCPACGGTGRK